MKNKTHSPSLIDSVSSKNLVDRKLDSAVLKGMFRETVNLFRLMLTGAIQTITPRATLAMINAAGMADADIGIQLRSEASIREL